LVCREQASGSCLHGTDSELTELEQLEGGFYEFAAGGTSQINRLGSARS
jgi:hypothetical protein